MKTCKRCLRPKPDYGSDETCATGGYCDWEEEVQSTKSVAVQSRNLAYAQNQKTSPMNVSWATGNGMRGHRMIWAFPCNAIVEGLEVEPCGSSYNGFIEALRVGLCDYLHMGPYPILMWSPGMPPVELWLPHVPYGSHFHIETRDFYGKIRPRGLVVNP